MAPMAATKRAGFVGMRGKKAAGKGGASVPSDALSAAKYYHKFDSWPYYLIPYASKVQGWTHTAEKRTLEEISFHFFQVPRRLNSFGHFEKTQAKEISKAQKARQDQ